MRRSPFGRTLALFDALIGYVVLTNPMASDGDESSNIPTRTAVDADEPGAIGVLAPMSSHAIVKELHQVDDDIRDLISPDYKIRGEGR